MNVVRLTQTGTSRVLSSVPNMLFEIDSWFDRSPGFGVGRVVHVKDWRYPGDHNPYQIWTLAPEDYEVVCSSIDFATLSRKGP
jgi:hypothetical protein